MKQDIDDMYPTTLTHTIKVCALSKFITQIYLNDMRIVRAMKLEISNFQIKSDCYFYFVCMYYIVVCTVIYIYIASLNC